MDDLNRVEQYLSDIAKRHLGVATLNTRNSDQLDFYDLSVWKIKDALKEAFDAGKSNRPTNIQKLSEPTLGQLES